MTEVTHGFGYDPVDEDFKILRVVTYLYKEEDDEEDVEEVDAEVKVDVEVFSVKMNAWRKLDEDCMPEDLLACTLIIMIFVLMEFCVALPRDMVVLWRLI